MASENFEKSLQFTLVYEGGYVNDPQDPGGATMRGITQKVYDDYRAGKQLNKRPVAQLEELELRDIYKARYWDMVFGDQLPPGVDYATFDYAVNSGVSRAVKELQKIAGTVQDGVMGPATLAAVLGYVSAHGAISMSDRICMDRSAFLRSLSTFPRFGKGWMTRVMGQMDGRQEGDTGVIDRAAGMALADDVKGPEAPVVTRKTYVS